MAAEREGRGAWDQDFESTAEEEPAFLPCQHCVTRPYVNGRNVCSFVDSHPDRCVNCCREHCPCEPIPRSLLRAAVLTTLFGAYIRLKAVQFNRSTFYMGRGIILSSPLQLVQFSRELFVLRILKTLLRQAIDMDNAAKAQTVKVPPEVVFVAQLLMLGLEMLFRFLVGDGMDYEEMRSRVHQAQPDYERNQLLLRLQRFMLFARYHDFKKPIFPGEPDWIAEFLAHPLDDLVGFFGLGLEGCVHVDYTRNEFV